MQILRFHGTKRHCQRPRAQLTSCRAASTVHAACPPAPALQGEFGAGEPVAAVFAWVADCLSDPLHTYELVLPSRRTLEVQAQSGALCSSSVQC